MVLRDSGHEGVAGWGVQGIDELPRKVMISTSSLVAFHERIKNSPLITHPRHSPFDSILDHLLQLALRDHLVIGISWLAIDVDIDLQTTTRWVRMAKGSAMSHMVHHNTVSTRKVMRMVKSDQ